MGPEYAIHKSEIMGSRGQTLIDVHSVIILPAKIVVRGFYKRPHEMSVEVEMHVRIPKRGTDCDTEYINSYA